MKNTKDEILKYSFTKYIDVALLRAKKDYISKEMKRGAVEEVTDLDVKIRSLKVAPEPQPEVLSLNPHRIRQYLSGTVDQRMEQCLTMLTDKELQIVYLKVFFHYAFIEIGEILSIDWKKVASIYSYARKKMQKGWRKDEF